MIDGETTVAVIAAVITFKLLLIGMIGSFVRMVRGPSVADRVVALDLLTVFMVGFAAVYAIASGQDAFLDAAIALALVGFLGTVALARYIERRERPLDEPTSAKETETCGTM